MFIPHPFYHETNFSVQLSIAITTFEISKTNKSLPDFINQFAFEAEKEVYIKYVLYNLRRRFWAMIKNS